ncbi:MAG: hypothetical protein ACETWG_05330 [Candidatus Neomarinimicrobiota bacterium]
MQFFRSHLGLIAFGLILLVTGCEEETREGQAGALVGSWSLINLKADWVREVASPEGTNPDTLYTLSASWDEAESVFGSEAHKADQVLAEFAVGDTVFRLDTTLNAAALVYLQIALTATFTEDFTYTLTGTYPALRLVPDLCQTELVIPQISDAGIYDPDYITFRLGIRPGAFDQILPAFNDGQFDVSEDGTTLIIWYIDRDGHDQRIAETGETWDEAENRVIHGAAELPVNIVTGAFATAGRLRRSGYIMGPSGRPENWGGYFTFYALIILDYADELIASGAADTFAEALAIITQWADAGQIEEQTDSTFATLLTDDSDHDFDPLNPGNGGKLTYVINPVCMPVNEIIYFETTWYRIE